MSAISWHKILVSDFDKFGTKSFFLGVVHILWRTSPLRRAARTVILASQSNDLDGLTSSIKFTYYVISRGGVSKCLRLITGGGVWSLIT